MSRAKLHNVSVLALTDHDTISGLARARVQAQIEGIDLINGIEFSCQWAGRGIHLVALAFDAVHDEMRELIESQRKLRLERSNMIAQRMEKLGFCDALARAQAAAGSTTIGRPHFAAAMVEHGFCVSVEQAFKRYLGAGKPGDVKQIWPEIGDVIPSIVASGGVAVLAHPLKYKLTRSKLLRLVDDFTALGGKAIEVVSGTQRPEDTRDMARIANKYEIYGSCGSDFHAPLKHWGELGKFPALPDNVVPVWRAWEH